MKFKIVSSESEYSEKTLAMLNAQKKWKAKYLDSVNKQEILRKARFDTKNEQDKIFVLIGYLTSSRRNEIIALNKVDVKKENYYYAPEDKTYEVFIFNMINQKNKVHKRKAIPIVKGLDDTIDIMLKEIEHYMEDRADALFDKYDPTIWNKRLECITMRTRYSDPNIPITENIVVDFRLFPHFLRHCRATHLSPLGPQVLVNVTGWSTSQMQKFSGISSKVLDTYIRRNWQGVADAMIRQRVA